MSPTYFAWLTRDKPAAADPLVLDLARALGALNGRRGTPAAFRAVMVAQRAMFAFADPTNERAAEVVDRMYAAAFGVDDGGERSLWYSVGDTVKGFRLLPRLAEGSVSLFVRRILDDVEHHYRTTIPDRPRAEGVVTEALMTPRLQPSGVVARILLGLDMAPGDLKALTKAISEAFRIRDRKAGRGGRPKKK